MRRLLDKLDKQILDCLYDDVRISNRKIASRLNITESTVRTRIQRMKDDKLVRFTAAVDSRVYTRPVYGFVGINTKNGALRDVSTALAQLPELNFVATMLGRYDIICTFLVKDDDALRELLHTTIPAIDGISDKESIQILHAHKFDRRWSVLAG